MQTENENTLPDRQYCKQQTKKPSHLELPLKIFF